MQAFAYVLLSQPHTGTDASVQLSVMSVQKPRGTGEAHRSGPMKQNVPLGQSDGT